MCRYECGIQDLSDHFGRGSRRAAAESHRLRLLRQHVSSVLQVGEDGDSLRGSIIRLTKELLQRFIVEAVDCRSAHAATSSSRD